MKISQEFEVPRSPPVVWEFFQDIPSVARCLPGAELMGQDEAGAHKGRVSMKLGPMTATFEGSATVEPDPANHTATLVGKGVDKRGGSRGQVKVDYSVSPSGSGSKVVVNAEVTLSGPAAQFGRTGLINEMSKRLINEFVACLEAKLEAATDEEADLVKAPDVNGISLFFASLWEWIKRKLQRRSS